MCTTRISTFNHFKALLGCPFPRSYYTCFNLSVICFEVLQLARTSKIFYISGKYIIYRVNITGKGLFSLRMKILQIHGLYTLINKRLHFYCVNTSYPMDNCFTGRRDRSRQTPEKDVLYIIPAGPVSSVHSLGGASYLLPV